MRRISNASAVRSGDGARGTEPSNLHVVSSRRRGNVIVPSISFAPIATAAARVLIVGSLPGQVSLARGEYYAQAQNAFWRIMGHTFGADPKHPYADRTEQLQRCGVALWDVCASARRAGSLDSSIDRRSVEPNDFAGFFALHPHIRLIGANGAMAAALYERLVRPGLDVRHRNIPLVVLPSTSAAHASMPYDEKLAAWSIVKLQRDQ